jgi:hypothetical protein
VTSEVPAVKRTELRKAAVILLAGTALVTAAVGAGAYFTVKATADTLTPGQWSGELMARTDAPRVFGVRFPERPARWRVRQLDLGDASLEALAELGDAAATARFLAANALKSCDGQPGELDAALDELHRLTHRQARATRACALPDDAEFERTLTLLEVEGSSWVLLDASPK